MEENNYKTRQEQRERKLKKKREHIQKHGGSLAMIYRNAIGKRSRSGNPGKKEKGFKVK